IDTGMGLERIAAVLQGVSDNYETDLFVPLIDKIKGFSPSAESSSVSVKIVADHSRAIVNLIADGVFPGNAGRDYVLRRLIRRAISHGKKLGIAKPFLCELAREVVKMMGDFYPDLKTKEQEILRVIQEEEEAFIANLEQGMKLFQEILARSPSAKNVAGSDAFKLHDTYGFPIELTVELAEEKGCRVDLIGFNKEMDAQRERARQTGLENDKRTLLAGLDLSHLKPTVFTGYEKGEEETKVVDFFPLQKLVVLEKTPFYGESGGQVGDTGIIDWEKNEILVRGTIISPHGVILHEVDRLDGLKENVKVKVRIDSAKRGAIQAHHTATHLLHKALR
ncbi:MAG TPA: alanine--tRNA ligase-related protein, partial [Candidatus Sulfotelmatobacter sp.]|nr:alanine--tRNA ligase-related protein [Candidatus Sulfotelmatobacter sp.]